MRFYDPAINRAYPGIGYGRGLVPPAIAQPVNTKRADIFKVRINRHLIIFEQTEHQVSIIRAVHEAMDTPRHIAMQD